MLYETFTKLKESITTFHLQIVSARALLTEEYCPMSVEDLQKHRLNVDKQLEQFD